MNTQLTDGTLSVQDAPLLSALPTTVSTIADPLGAGLLLSFSTDKPGARIVFDAGQLTGIRRFVSLRRYEPYWMLPEVGTRGGQVPIETQFLMVEREDGSVAVLVPLIDGVFRCSLQGTGEQGLQLVVESADLSVVTSKVMGLFVAAGSDAYELIERAARSVNGFIGIGRLRKDKAVPRFVDQFGWCTWDAFYQEVSQEKVRVGLQSFRDGDVEPRLLILDDGWQSVRKMPSGNVALTAFKANGKFPDDLKPVVDTAKKEFGIQTFMVWHAMMGYWGGVDAEALPGYGVRNVPRNSSEGIKHYQPGVDVWWGPTVGLVAPEHIYRFFQDYHRHLRSQGVDGVKVDSQAALESFAQGSGGRAELMRRYHEALEGSVHVHFQGELINCMSCAAEMLYGSPNSAVTRTSTDFWPKKPESHGLHLYVNALVSLWFGQFIFPDWDMFQSAHPMGSYHAAGRAVGGCPVYVSDKPDEHNFDLLRKMVLRDGSILRCLDSGRPTRDCLFRDPTKEDVLLKIFNRNAIGGVVGVFNARYGGEGKTTAPIAGTLSPSDIPGLSGDTFAVYAHQSQTLRVLSKNDKLDISLPELTWELFTLIPVHNGFAPIGLPDMLNSAGAIASVQTPTPHQYKLSLRAGGRFLAYARTKPTTITVNDTPAKFTYDPTAQTLTVHVPASGPLQLLVSFE